MSRINEIILGIAYQVVTVVRNASASSEDSKDMCSVPGLGRCPGGVHGNPLQYSCLENPMGRGAWQATVHGVTKSLTLLKWLSTVHEVVMPKWKRYAMTRTCATTVQNKVIDTNLQVLNFSKGTIRKWMWDHILRPNQSLFQKKYNILDQNQEH